MLHINNQLYMRTKTNTISTDKNQDVYERQMRSVSELCQHVLVLLGQD